MAALLLILGIVLVVPLLVAAVVVGMFIGPWIRARASGVNVPFTVMIAMKLRGLDPCAVIDRMIAMAKAGVEVGHDEIESHVLAGGNLDAVTDALISVEKAGLGMNYQQLAAIDLAGRDIGDAVRTHVSPKVLACPAPAAGRDSIQGVCGDGIRLSVTARVTVRTRLDRLVGGAGEDTVIARVGEGIVAAIGRASTHMEILAGPERISDYLLSRGLDSGTCFEILSVDIANVTVEDNIGARLRSEQAAADKRVAQARAEARRTAAVAARTEMTARTTQMAGRVVSAQAVVPRAQAAALTEHNLGRRRALPPTFNHRIRWQIAAE